MHAPGPSRLRLPAPTAALSTTATSTTIPTTHRQMPRSRAYTVGNSHTDSCASPPRPSPPAASLHTDRAVFFRRRPAPLASPVGLPLPALAGVPPSPPPAPLTVTSWLRAADRKPTWPRKSFSRGLPGSRRDKPRPASRSRAPARPGSPAPEHTVDALLAAAPPYALPTPTPAPPAPAPPHHHPPPKHKRLLQKAASTQDLLNAFLSPPAVSAGRTPAARHNRSATMASTTTARPATSASASSRKHSSRSLHFPSAVKPVVAPAQLRHSRSAASRSLDLIRAVSPEQLSPERDTVASPDLILGGCIRSYTPDTLTHSPTISPETRSQDHNVDVLDLHSSTSHAHHGQSSAAPFSPVSPVPDDDVPARTSPTLPGQPYRQGPRRGKSRNVLSTFFSRLRTYPFAPSPTPSTKDSATRAQTQPTPVAEDWLPSREDLRSPPSPSPAAVLEDPPGEASVAMTVPLALAPPDRTADVLSPSSVVWGPAQPAHTVRHKSSARSLLQPPARSQPSAPPSACAPSAAPSATPSAGCPPSSFPDMIIKNASWRSSDQRSRSQEHEVGEDLPGRPGEGDPVGTELPTPYRGILRPLVPPPVGWRVGPSPSDGEVYDAALTLALHARGEPSPDRTLSTMEVNVQAAVNYAVTHDLMPVEVCPSLRSIHLTDGLCMRLTMSRPLTCTASYRRQCALAYRPSSRLHATFLLPSLTDTPRRCHLVRPCAAPPWSRQLHGCLARRQRAHSILFSRPLHRVHPLATHPSRRRPDDAASSSNACAFTG